MGSLQLQSVLKGSFVSRRNDQFKLHKIFGQIAAKCSSHPAIVYEHGTDKDRSISYGDLEDLTNRLAAVIRGYSQDEDKDSVVAVSMRPTNCLPITLLSILKADKAYLPLDPDFPSSRIKHILQDAEPILAIVDDKEDASIYEGTPVITYSQLIKEAEFEKGETIVQDKKDPEQIAIVLYTSGSTGVPKGVKLPHRTILNRLQWQWGLFPYQREETRCIFKTALTFVDSVSEIWGPLLQGRTLVVIPKHVTKDPQAFIQVLDDHKIQRLVLVPSLLQSLLMYLSLQDERGALDALKLWICSGETLMPSLAEQFFKRFPNRDYVLANFYGSTEVMGDVTYHILKDLSDLEEVDKVPIGKPVDNTIVYLVNEDLQIVPQGEIGELIVTGRNLSAGYIRGKDSTKFLQNPHTVDPQYSRIFRTGDYAKIVKGVLIYEGRKDSQVKIRGHRVDLTEVEKVLSTAPMINKAVVLCYKPGELSQTLVAFVTTTGDAYVSESCIEAHLRSRLPPYMIPQVVTVDSIPLLVNGKTDRHALLTLYETKNKNDHDRTIDCDYDGVPEELHAAAKILFPTVASVIGHSVRQTISVNSNFYELGGNSLNSVYTVTKLRDQGYYIGITDFIKAKDMRGILSKMKIGTDSDSFLETVNLEEHVLEELNESHKEDVIRMVTDSFYSKADLEQWLMPDITREDYRELVEALWEPLIEKGFSFVIKSIGDRPENNVLAVGLNFDAHDEPEVSISSKLTIVFEFLEYLEGPIRDNRLPKGKGQILHSFMMATNSSLTSAENVIVMREMEEHCLVLARQKGFAGIFTTNTSPLTQQLGIDVYCYDVLLDYQVNEYIAPDGSRPFGQAPDDQRAVCSWKAVK